MVYYDRQEIIYLKIWRGWRDEQAANIKKKRKRRMAKLLNLAWHRNTMGSTVRNKRNRFRNRLRDAKQQQIIAARQEDIRERKRRKSPKEIYNVKKKRYEMIRQRRQARKAA